MNQLFEFAINTSHSVTEAYNKLWSSTAGFTLMTIDEILRTQKHYLYNLKGVTSTKLVEFLCIEGRLPVYDPSIIQDIYNRNTVLFHNLWHNSIINLIYFDWCNYEFSSIDDNEVNFLIGMAENKEELANYIDSSIDNWVDRNECIMNLNANIKIYMDKINSVPLNTLPGMKHNNISEEITEIIREGFLHDEFVMKGVHEPLNLLRNPKLHSDMIYYLSGLHQYYNEFMFKHPYYYSVEEFINTVMEDIETGIKYGVLEYYLDDTERRSRYDKEIDALIYAHLTSVINRG